MMLRLDSVRYTYAGASQPVLDDIDIEVAAGRVVGVVGPNDAGKSTLCLIAAGLAPRAIGGRLEGSVTLSGIETVDLKPHEVAQRSGILFQNPFTQLSGTAATVFEEIAFGPRNLGLDLPVIVERVEFALDQLGIDALAPRDPLKLSGGQAQLVALASVLALRPGLLVLDEPTSQLDPAGTRLVGDALRRFVAEAGTAILIVEHKTGLLAELANEVVVLNDGRIAERGETAVILGDSAIEAVGVGPPEPVTLRRAAARRGVEDRVVALDLTRLRAPAASADPGDRTLRRSVRSVPASGGTGSGATASTDRPLAIRCSGVVFEYPSGTRAIDGVDLSVAAGERIAIIGQNGSGKSTLVRQFNGLLRPLAGEVTILGELVGNRHVAEVARQVGLTFQNPDRQIFARRVRDEVAFGARNVGLRGAELDGAVEAALDAVGLRSAEGANPYDLGYSKRKLLAVASILSMGTPIVILDEPTTGQDARGVARIRAIIDELDVSGRTVIAISHDMRFVAESFARVVVMGAGRVILDGTPGEIFAEENWPILASTYLEPTYAAQVGARLGLGSTPTETSVVDILAGRST